MKILFVDMHREGRSPSQRYRYEQYLDYLVENNIKYEHSFLINEKDDIIFYQKGHYFKKFLILLKSVMKRIKDVNRANRDIDVVFVQREALMLGTTYFERQFAKSKAKFIYDFDDSIWMNQQSKASAPNKKLNWLKRPNKTREIIKIADLVITGNQYLAEYAYQYNDKVEIIPTTIDTNLYKPKKESEYQKKVICIGWTGSKTTIDHFELLLPVLEKIKEKYKSRVNFNVIGDADYSYEPLNINGIPWQAETEIEDLKQFDIGVMPLPDDEWTKGKCGCKGLQYMGAGIPTLMSPVGVNNEIIDNGVNGFLPVDENDWVEKLSTLIESEELRREMGKNGRQTVQNSYSSQSQYNKFYKLLCSLE